MTNDEATPQPTPPLPLEQAAAQYVLAQRAVDDAKDRSARALERWRTSMREAEQATDKLRDAEDRLHLSATHRYTEN